jgi:6-phosphogluconate dehydrogenase
MSHADLGLIGLAVMGQNLVLNMNDHGYTVAVYNRTRERTEGFLQGAAHGTRILGVDALEDLIRALKKPRVVMLMVKAGAAVDGYIEQLLPYLEAGDVVIDGGNSDYTDTNRRVSALAECGIHYLGVGISGGEEGARHGPSIMPGGNRDAWPRVEPLFKAIAAKVDGVPCCEWVGLAGAGHYVKMVHNGIEYGDMQLIAEAYQLLRVGLQLDVDRIANLFSEWDQGVLSSYLIQITGHILRARDDDGAPLVDKILDTAGQKGTGKWTGVSALELGVPLTLIGEAVFARYLSALKAQRLRAAEVLPAAPNGFDREAEAYIDPIRDALYASKIISYTQGFMLLGEAAQSYGWTLDYATIARLWRGGCIIRSRFLNNIAEAFQREPDLPNLLLDSYFGDALAHAEAGWRAAVTVGIQLGIPLPAFTSALAFYDGLRSMRLPANLIQAQRDYFGAHTYERIDHPRGSFFHTDWKAAVGVPED